MKASKYPLFVRSVLCDRHPSGWSIVLTVLLLISCAESSDPALEKNTFTSIFDHNGFSEAFYPIDILQTADGGYLIVAERKITGSNFRGIYILKADAFGNFEKEIVPEDQYVNPVGQLMNVDDDFYFFAMDALTLQAQLIRVGGEADGVTITPVDGITYPAAASIDNNNFLLLSYNHIDKASVVSKHNPTGQLTLGPKGFGIGAGETVEEPIVNHFIRTGKKLPFQVGKASEGLYFFNGFENYTFSLVFTDMREDEPLGVVHGQQDDGGFSAVMALGGDQFAAARFDFGENYFLPGVSLETSGASSSAFLDGNVYPELIPNAAVKIIKADVGARKTIVYASDTKSKQIGLFFYDAGTGAFIGSRYLGFSNPFEVAGLIQTEDNGLAICGTTYLAGRFPRICLFKISESEVSRLVE
jgi:hypothetical protein